MELNLPFRVAAWVTILARKPCCHCCHSTSTEAQVINSVLAKDHCLMHWLHDSIDSSPVWLVALVAVVALSQDIDASDARNSCRCSIFLFLVHPDARNASLSAATVQHVREGRFFGEWRPESCDENCRLRVQFHLYVATYPYRGYIPTYDNLWRLSLVITMIPVVQ